MTSLQGNTFVTAILIWIYFLPSRTLSSPVSSAAGNTNYQLSGGDLEKLNLIVRMTSTINAQIPNIQEILINQTIHNNKADETFYDKINENSFLVENIKYNLEKLENSSIDIQNILTNETALSSNIQNTLNNQTLQIERMEELLQSQTKQYQIMLEKLEEQQRQISLMSLPQNCEEAIGDASGVYQIYLPFSGLEPFYVYCLREKNSVWTIVQRRLNGTENFFRNWNDYKNGFGNLSGEFFIGLDKLHAITTHRQHELWINLKNFQGLVRSAYYNSFAIDNENSQYAIKSLGNYSGDANDALKYHNKMKFSTKDKDNDKISGNCAQYYESAWWYSDCFHVDLNGQYRPGNNTHSHKGIFWIDWLGHTVSLMHVHMGIREKK